MAAPALNVYLNGPVAVTADNFNTFMQTCNTANDLRAFIGTIGQTVQTRGLSAVNDGQGGNFYWNGSSNAPDDNLNVIRPAAASVGAWIRLVLDINEVIGVVTNYAALRALTTYENYPAVYVGGYSTPTDGGEGMFWYVSTDVSSPDNNGTILVDSSGRRWYRESGGPISAAWFGAVAGLTDYSISLQQWLTVSANASAYLPPGNYPFSTALTSSAPVRLVGAGEQMSVLQPAAGIVALTFTTASKVVLESFGIAYPTAQTSGLYAIKITASGGAENALSTIRDVQISLADSGVQWTNSAFFLMDHVFIENFATNGVQVSNAVNIDVGDSNITNCTFFDFAGESTGSGINWLSSGGLRVENNKFGALATGINFQYATDSGSAQSNTAQLIVTGNSFDTMSNAAISMTRSTSTDVFNSVIIANNVMPDCNVGLSVPLDANGSWLTSVVVTGNEWIGPASGSPVGFEVQSTGNINISNNTLFGNVAGTVGISVGSSVSGGIVQGNNLSGTFGTTIVTTGTAIRVLDNQGVNPIGVTTPTPGSSPWTYTCGASPQTVYLSASTSITGITYSSNSLLPAASGANVVVTVGLGPNEAIIISYTGTLTAHVMTH